MASDQIKKTLAALKFLGHRVPAAPDAKHLALVESMQSHMFLSPSNDTLVDAPPITVEAPVGSVTRWSDGHLYKKLAVGWELLPDSSNPNMTDPKAATKDTPPKPSLDAEHEATPAEHNVEPGAQDVLHQNSAPVLPKHDFPKGPAYINDDGGKYHVMKQDEMGVYHKSSSHDTESAARSAVITHADHNGRQAHPDFAHSMIRFERNIKPGHEVHLKFDGMHARAQVTKVNDGSIKARLMHSASSPMTAHAPGSEITVPRAITTLKDPTSKWHKANGAFPITDETPKADTEAMHAIAQNRINNGHASNYRVGDRLTVAHPAGHVHDMLVNKVDKRFNRITLRHAIPGEGKDGYVLDMAGFAGAITKRATAPMIPKAVSKNLK